MASPDIDMSDSSSTEPGQWLAHWSSWLDLWIESGTDSPGPAAVEALQRWISTIPEDSFSELSVHAECLLANNVSRGEKADALLSMIVWHQASSRIFNTAA